jgi:hypothetical protein
MDGEISLNVLLKNMKPEMQNGEYLFCTSPLLLKDIFKIHGQLNPVCLFQEQEGTTLILPESEARLSGLTVVYPCRWITLNIHSSLEAVGFMAKITENLSSNGISVNPVSAYYHDHIFVPSDKADKTMVLLQELTL